MRERRYHLLGRPGGTQAAHHRSAEARQTNLLVAADVNAVPPAGVEGVGVNDNGKPIPGTKAVGIGALAVGNIKYKTESGLFKQMIEADKPLYLDFRDAYALAQKLAG